MKAERRQQLKENELIHVLESARVWLDANGKYVIAIVLAIALLLVGSSLYSSSRANTLQSAWLAYAELSPPMSPADYVGYLNRLEGLLDESTDETFQITVLSQRGSLSLKWASEGTPAPDAALNDIAAASFRQLKDAFPRSAIAQGTALFGLATTEGNAFALDRDQSHKAAAKRYLEQIRDDAQLNGTPFQASAIAKLQELDDFFTPVTFVDPPPPPPAAAEGDSGDEAPAPDEAAPVGGTDAAAEEDAPADSPEGTGAAQP